MKIGGGSQKGSEFERSICKQLSLWWTNGERDDIFWRTAGSGGRGTQRSKKGQTTAGGHGDLTFTDPIGKPLLDLCCFELKRGYKPSLLDLIDRRPSKNPSVLMDFWQQANTSARNAEVAYGIVIFKRDQKKVVIMFSQAFYIFLQARCGDYKGLRLIVKDPDPEENTVLMPFDDFLEWATPESILQIQRRTR